MNRNLRLKIEDAISSNTWSANLLYLCLAALQEKITYTPISTTHYEQQRNILAKYAVANGIDKAVLVEKMKTISKDDYPTLKTITKIVDLIQNGYGFFVDDFIPNRMIHYKSDAQIAEDAKRKPAIKKRDIENEQFSELIQLVRKEYNNNLPLNSHQNSKLQKMKTSVYTFEVILKTFNDYSKDIQQSLWGKSFKSGNDRFDYICAIVENHLNDTVSEIERRAEIERMDDIAFTNIHAESATYQPKSTVDKNRKFSHLW